MADRVLAGTENSYTMGFMHGKKQMPFAIRQVSVNTVSQIIGRIISSGSSFIASILIARTLGLTEYGNFTKITTFVALFYLGADFGLNAIAIKRSDDNDTSWAANLSALRIIISLIVLAGLCIVIPFLPSSGTSGYTSAVKYGMLLFSPTIIFQAIMVTCNAVFQKYLRYDMATKAIAAGSLTTLTLLVYSFSVYSTRVSLSMYLGILLSGSAVTALVSLYFTRSFLSLVPDFHWSRLRSIFWETVPLGLTLLCNVVYFRVDHIILTLTQSTQDVGIYGLAYKLFEFPLAIPTFLMNSLYPLILASRKKQEYRYTSFRFISSLIAVAFVLVIVCWVASPLIVYVKPEFFSSILPFRVLSLGLPAFFISSLVMWQLVSMGKRYLLFGFYIFFMVLSVICNALYIPHYGYMAAAWITTISETVLAVSGYFLIRSLSNSQS